MATLALVLFALYTAVVFAGRAVVLRRSIGTAGWHGISGPAGSAAWWGGVLFAVALLGGLVAPLAALAGVSEPLAALDRTGVHGLGVALFAAGLVASLAAQRAMGASWRVGVDAGERTALVGDGVFAHVRNPFFTALVVASLGLALLVPSLVSTLALAALVAAIELQVRFVEEPHLRAQHGDAYARYVARAGRFVPGVGRLQPSGRAA